MADPKELIRKEREGASFPVRELTYLLDGSEEETRYKEQAIAILQREPILLHDNFFDITRPEARAKSMAQIRKIFEIKKSIKDPRLARALDMVMNIYDRSYGMRTYVHDILFRETILTHGTPTQFKHWQDDIDEMRVLGCFAMTELGHSSFLRGLETTATFDPKTQEFVVNSPTLTSTKWWIGMAGQVATHTVAICQLIVNGKELGLHWFIVPLRNPADGQLVPGMLCGDVGAKAGRAGLDNGWIQFKNVRIPREYMLMKWSHLSPSGELTQSGDPTLAYNTLIGERIIVPAGVADAVGQAITIGIRYAVIRQQGPNDEKIMDYQSHYHTLIPMLATLYATHMVGRRVRGLWADALLNQDKDQQKFVKSLGDYHGISAGMKAWLGWWGADSLEQIRRSMGGHGYSAYSAIPGLIADFAVITQGGGDNVVLAQQTARYLVGSLRKAMSGKPLTGSVQYLSGILEHSQTKSHFPAKTAADLLNIDWLLNALRWLATEQITQAGSALLKASQSKGLEEAWNDMMMELLVASRVHTWYYVGYNFVDIIRQCHPGPVRTILEKLAVLFLLYRVNAEMHLFLEGGYIDPQQAKLIRQQIVDSCKEIRPQAIPLVDALGLPDVVIKSPFGRFDGDVYTKYFEMANKAPNSVGRPAYWEKEVAPLITRYQKQKASL